MGRRRKGKLSYPSSGPLGLPAGGHKRRHDDNSKAHADDQSEEKRPHQQALSARRYEDRCQSLDIGLGHIAEPQADVEPGWAGLTQLGTPYDVCPAPDGGVVRQENLEVEAAPNGEILIGEYPHAPQADVLCVAFVVKHGHPGRLA